MSHREQHYAGLHHQNIMDIGFSWKDHPPPAHSIRIFLGP